MHTNVRSDTRPRARMLHDMNKRNLASVLWFLAGWSGGGLLVGVLGLPDLLAFVPAVVFAVLVRVDPGDLLWSHSWTGRRIPARRTVPMEQFAAELGRRTTAPGAVAAESRRT